MRLLKLLRERFAIVRPCSHPLTFIVFCTAAGGESQKEAAQLRAYLQGCASPGDSISRSSQQLNRPGGPTCPSIIASAATVSNDAEETFDYKQVLDVQVWLRPCIPTNASANNDHAPRS